MPARDPRIDPQPGDRVRASWIIELEDGVWLAPGKGDPARTIVRDNARRFNTRARATLALRDARTYRPFAKAEVVKEDNHE